VTNADETVGIKRRNEMKDKAKWSAVTVCIISLLSITVTQGSKLMYVGLILAGCSLVALWFVQTRKATLGRKALIGGLSIAGVVAGIVAAFFLRS
jgi:accessory gene regulator protein AgrB